MIKMDMTQTIETIYQDDLNETPPLNFTSDLGLLVYIMLVSKNPGTYLKPLAVEPF